jgi:hypothetical protein
LRRQEVNQQGGQIAALERPGDVLVPRAVAAAPAAVREQDNAVRLGRHPKITVERPIANRHTNGRRISQFNSASHVRTCRS